MQFLEFLLLQMQGESEIWQSAGTGSSPAEVEDAVDRGLTLFALIRRGAEAWGAQVAAGLLPRDPERVRQIHGAYVWWLGPCDLVLGQLARLENFHAPVKGAGAFRASRAMARKIVAVDPDRLMALVDKINAESGPAVVVPLETPSPAAPDRKRRRTRAVKP